MILGSFSAILGSLRAMLGALSGGSSTTPAEDLEYFVVPAEDLYVVVPAEPIYFVVEP